MAEELSIGMGGGLFQIAEPERKRGPKRRAGFGIGIDLGTTHSLVAIAPGGAAPRVLGDDAGELLTPSVVDYSASEPVVGARARARVLVDPQRVVASAKRFMGRGVEDIDFAHPYVLGGEDGVVRLDVGTKTTPRTVSPVQVSADILSALKARAERELGGPVDGAVITVPAYFDDAQRQATKDAGRVAGLRVYRLLAEPTAAALAYGLDRKSEGLFAVYDLGGGTFDISILRLRGGVFQVLATGGDSALGGDDFDRALAGLLLEAAGVEEPSPSAHAAAQSAARAAKERLSVHEETRVSVEGLGLVDHPLGRATLEEVIAPLVRRTISASRRAMKDAEVSADQLDGVVLVGGSTRVPAVREAVRKTFGREPLVDIDPDLVVAQGAAIQADILSGSPREGVTLLDVVPLSLGLETMGGIVEKIIPRNATIPIAARQVFTNYSEKQTGMTFNVVQGERELAADCRSLARFDLSGIPRLPPSMARIEVTFELDADALLCVTARELMTGTKAQVEVKPTHGVSEAEIEAMIGASMDFAGEDFAARNRAEARVELGRVQLAVETAMAEIGHLPGVLPDDERSSIESALLVADETMADDAADAARIEAVRKALESVSEEFARRRMERALNAGMSGKSLNEIEGALAGDEDLERRRGAHGAEEIEEG